VGGVEYDNGKSYELSRVDGKIVAEQINKLPYDKYPVSQRDDVTPVLRVWEKPFIQNGTVPRNLYYICYDPVRFDEGTSLCSAFVCMNLNNVVPSRGDYIVAEFTGRSETIDDYHKQLFMIAEWYNAEIGAENDVGTIVMDYAKRFNKTHLLAKDFELAHDVRFSTLRKNRRGFGMSMASGKDNLKKIVGVNYFRDWLLTERTTTLDGKIILNLHTIKSKGLLRESLKFDLNNGNFDRISAMIIGMYQKREYEYTGRIVSTINNQFKKLLNHKFYV
jgi:hypothetical protein